MRPVANQTDIPPTTEAILAATAERPLHLRNRADLIFAAVSSESIWTDRTWLFDNPTPGAKKSTSTIVWDLNLPDGRNLFDPHHTDLLDWMRRLVWSAYAAPGDGAGVLKPGSLGNINSGMRYWTAWLVDRHIACPAEIHETVVTDYIADLKGSTEDDADTRALTEAVAYSRLMPFALLWRQRFALARAGIDPMPAPPFGRAGVFKIAKEIAAVVKGSYRPLPDEVSVPVLNAAMAMLSTPAQDVIALAETCAAAYASRPAENVGPDRQRTLAARRQSAAARNWQFGDVDGKPWHGPLNPQSWDRAVISTIETNLGLYLTSCQTDWPGRTGSPDLRRTLPTVTQWGREVVDLQQIGVDLGLRSGKEQLLKLHPKLRSLISAAAKEHGLPAVPKIRVMHRVRQLVQDIRSAAQIVIQATTGMRISEICGMKAGIDPQTGLPKSVTVRDSLSGLAEVFVIFTGLSKTEETQRNVEWTLGYRPKGSPYLPPAVQAIIVLDRLLAPYRAMLDSDELFVSFTTSSSLPKTRKGVGRILAGHLRNGVGDFISNWVDLTGLPDNAARRTMDNELVPYRASCGRCIGTHQWRKTFGHFVTAVDRRLLHDLQMHFHHVASAMTDGAYTGNPVLARDINDVRYQHMAMLALDIAEGDTRIGGRFGEDLERKVRSELGPRINGVQAEEAYREAFVYVEEAGLDRLFFEPHGICGARSASQMACHEEAGTTALARWSNRLMPNYETRTSTLCAGCDSFAIAKWHLPFWEERYIE